MATVKRGIETGDLRQLDDQAALTGARLWVDKGASEM
jgi:hypothetical protein